MEFVGNFAEYIKDEWNEEILSLPREWPICFKGSPEYDRLINAGYNLSSSNWSVIDPEDISFVPNFPFMDNDSQWWVARLLPGQFMPMHIDPHPPKKTGKFYWIPLQDYEPGHIFVINDEIITNYKKGDAYIFDNLADPHCAANLGYGNPKTTLIICVYDK
jgi:hypothetical protein